MSGRFPPGSEDEDQGRGVTASDDVIDLRRCKAAAMRLPPNHPLRLAIVQEPDELPRSRGLGKLETYIRLAMALR